MKKGALPSQRLTGLHLLRVRSHHIAHAGGLKLNMRPALKGATGAATTGGKRESGSSETLLLAGTLVYPPQDVCGLAHAFCLS